MAAKFWVGGTGTWDSTSTTHWATTSGGASGAAAPTTGDAVTFDGSSGGGTVSVDSSVNNLSLASITCGQFTGTIDFSVGNPSMTLTGTAPCFNISGNGTRTITMGSGTFTLNAINSNVIDAGTITGLTFNAGTSTFVIGGTPNTTRTLSLNNLTYNNITINSWSNAIPITISGGPTISTLTLQAGANDVQFTSGTTTTISTLSWTGSASAPIYVKSSSNTAAATISTPSGAQTGSYVALQWMTFSTGGGATWTFNNSFDLKSNSGTGLTINGPSGGAVGVIGG